MSATQTAQTSYSDGGGMGTISAHIGEPTAATLKPFVGLVPLVEEDAKLLAGRDEEIKVLMTNLRAARLTIVYGPSGVGKSSILRAGVVASLRKLGEEELNNFGTPGFAVVILSSWAGDPFVQLNKSVQEGIKSALDVETLPSTPVTYDLVKMLRTWTDRYGFELLVILDQFEEFFLYHQDEKGAGTFAYEFPLAVSAPDLRVRFMLSLRDDSLHMLDRFKSGLPALFENRLQIAPLTRANAERAIEKARAAYNETQPATERVEIGAGLIENVLDQVRIDNVGFGSNGLGGVLTAVPTLPSVGVIVPSSTVADSIDAPYMQLVMSRLWDEESARWKQGDPSPRVLRLETLKRLGGAQAVVQQHLDKVLRNFSKRERDIASDCFHHLVTLSGTKYALTPAELKDFTHHPTEEIKYFLDKLADPQYRIMRRIDKKTLKGTETAYEAHHDRLALAMLEWRGRREERRRLFWKRLRLLGFAILIAIPVFIFFYRKTIAETMALRNANAAREKEKAAQRNANIAVLELGEVQGDLSNANKGVETADETLTLLRSSLPKFVCQNIDPKLQPDADKITYKLGIDCKEFEQMRSKANDTLLRPRIYFQIQTEDQRKSANELRAWLGGQKYDGRQIILPGVENVGPRNLRSSQLRYFHNNVDEVGLAGKFALSLKDSCVDVKPLFVPGFEDSEAIRPRHFELWLTPDALAQLCLNDGSDAQP
jgi:hypothetical protein